jgi:cellulose synthase/poly-beta-1,6-N-acetylglucosamine synthase-like glycosyltransferase
VCSSQISKRKSAGDPMIIEILQAFFVAVISLTIVYLIRHYIFTLTVLRQAKNSQPHDIKQQTDYEPTVSLLIPARNEEKVIGKLLQRIIEFTYPKDRLQVIVVNDASADNTGKIADHYAKICPFIEVVHRDKKIGGKGKPSALNAGVTYATGEILLFLDADYSPLRDFVEVLVAGFVDPKVGAVQGRPVVGNEPQNIKTRIITLERIGGFRIDQEARNVLGLMPQFGGTVGGFRGNLLRSLGGFDEKMLTEDTDITVQIYLKGYEIRYVPNSECYEEAVTSWKAYWQQRHRWAFGHMQVCFKHGLSVIKSKKLTVKQKLDCLLLLHVYFMPVFTLFSCLVGIPLILLGASQIVNTLWFFIPISLYSFVGNFAPFFEVGIGAYLDGRSRIQWLCPLLIFLFFFNMLICTKAFFDLIGEKVLRKNQSWAKTMHVGTGDYFFPRTFKWEDST